MQYGGHGEMRESMAQMERLRHKFVEEEDDRLLSAVQAVLEEAKEAVKKRETDAKDLIQDLVRRNAEAKSAAEYPSDPDAHKKRLEELKQDKKQAEESLQNAQKKIWQEELEEQQLMNRELDVEDQKNELKDILDSQIPRARSKLALFLNVSNLTWRLTSPSLISGSLSDLQKTDIKEFDIDLDRHSKFEAVQQVWQHIDSRA